MSRVLTAVAAAAVFFAAAPASAQFFLKPPDLSGPPVTGAEPGIVGPALPDATPQELRAALVWNLRAALNVAALQCQFEPTLRTVDNYNAVIKDHATELKKSYETLGGYFSRVNKDKKKGQLELDRFGTRVYSGFSTISAQYTFCQAAGEIGHRALFAPRGAFGIVAEERMRELRNSLTRAGEQQFPSVRFQGPRLPSFDRKCWRKDVYNARKCGPAPL